MQSIPRKRKQQITQIMRCYQKRWIFRVFLIM